MTTVGVAWACVLWSPDPVWRPQRPKEDCAWPARAPEHWSDRCSTYAIRGFGRSTTFAIGTEKPLALPAEAGQRPHDTSAPVSQMVQAAGWPLESMYTVQWFGGFAGVPARSRLFAAGVRAPRWLPHRSDRVRPMGVIVRESLPLRIYPARFALTAGLYAGAWWLPLFAPGLIRRSLRRRRGRCIGCGYDLAGLAVENGARTCPECGAIDRARPRAPAES